MEKQIFYSWQSDITFNNQAIRDALKYAIIDLEANPDNPRIRSIDSSSNQSGAGRIPELIMNDISNSDIFVCDLTIINSGSSGRKVANPNVLIELGYAIAELSWYRTIVIFNENMGDIKIDLPFDIEKRSVLTMKIESKDDSNGKGILKTKLKEWIQRIVISNPAKPVKGQVQIDKIKRQSDLKNMRKFLTILVIEELDEFFRNGHLVIDRYLIGTFDEFHEFIVSKEFFMYDQKANDLLVDLNTTLKSIVDLSKDYKEGRISFKHKNYKSSNPAKFEKARLVIRKIDQAYSAVINHIRNNYLEIKIKK